jgi:DNA processing protein
MSQTSLAYHDRSSFSAVTALDASALYLAGDVSLLARPAVSVIGSRRASATSLASAAQVAAELVARGYVVVSGLAAGIDAAAHEAAMLAGGRTIAVLGTSLDRVYPTQHATLQGRIQRDHLIVSPFPRGTRTARWHFPARNRVMARLSLATVLVDATEESGTRHQVGECVKLGRVVFARSGLVESLSWLRGARKGAVVGWTDARELGSGCRAKEQGAVVARDGGGLAPP